VSVKIFDLNRSQGNMLRKCDILSFAKTPAGFKISKIRQPRVTCYLDEFGRRTQLLRTTVQPDSFEII
jgi:hypothetical protein